MDAVGDGWRWSNVPIPEAHVAGLVASAVLHALAPRTAFGERRCARLAGCGLLAGGLLLVGWAVRTMGDVDAERPVALATTGPYAFSRNPMYVGWTGLYTGLALLANSAWPFVLLPLAAVATHRVVRREERALERAFPGEYRAYRLTVRRYL